jgi:putative ABC transport system ATP-binding protein
MITVRGLVKTYIDGDKETQVLKGLDFVANDGEFIAIVGKSGAGKSTFLYQMSLLDNPTSGEIIIDEVDTHNLTSDQKTSFRLDKLGYVFQDYALLPDLTALENIALPLLMKGVEKKEAYRISEESLNKFNLGHRINNLPSQLSGGEQQRVSVARAIAHKPKILFADEPTANLDNTSSETVIKLFRELNDGGQTIIMVTHEEEYAKMADRIVTLDDGRIVG